MYLIQIQTKRFYSIQNSDSHEVCNKVVGVTFCLLQAHNFIPHLLFNMTSFLKKLRHFSNQKDLIKIPCFYILLYISRLSVWQTFQKVIPSQFASQ